MVTLTDAWRRQYEADFAKMQISPSRNAEAISVAKRLNASKSRYAAVSQQTGVPWFLIAAIHQRESSGDFGTYLGDGEPLDHKSHNVPQGRGPFKTFEAGAVDALFHEGFNRVTDWSIGSILFHAEEYNGEGYHSRGLPSPYVWAGSSEYQSGKFDVDGHFVANLVDKQLGVAVLIKTLITLKFIEDPSQPTQEAPMAMTNTTPPANPSIDIAAILDNAIDAAKTSGKTIWASVAGMFSSVTGGGLILTLAQKLDPGLLLWATSAIGIAVMIVGAGASAYHLVTHLDAKNNAVVALSEHWLNDAQALLGLAVTDFTSANNGGVGASPVQTS